MSQVLDFENTAEVPPRKKPNKRRNKTLPRLLLRSELDHRTSSAKFFDQLVSEIEADLSGRDQLSAIEIVLVEAFAGAAVKLYSLNAKLALGQEIDGAEHSQCVGALIKVATRLGLKRRAKDTNQTLTEYLSKYSDVAGDAE